MVPVYDYNTLLMLVSHFCVISKLGFALNLSQFSWKLKPVYDYNMLLMLINHFCVISKLALTRNLS